MGFLDFLGGDKPRQPRELPTPVRRRGGRLSPDERTERAKARQREAEARVAQTWAREQQRYLAGLRQTDPGRYQAVMEARLGIGGGARGDGSLSDALRMVKNAKRELAAIDGEDDEADGQTGPLVVPGAPPILSAVLNSGVGIQLAQGLRAFLEAGAAAQAAAMGLPAGPAVTQPQLPPPQQQAAPMTPQRPAPHPAMQAREQQSADAVATLLNAAAQTGDQTPEAAAQAVVGYAVQMQQQGDPTFLAYLYQARGVGAGGLRFLAGQYRRHPQFGAQLGALLDRPGWFDAFLGTLFGLLGGGGGQPAPTEVPQPAQPAPVEAPVAQPASANGPEPPGQAGRIQRTQYEEWLSRTLGVAQPSPAPQDEPAPGPDHPTRSMTEAAGYTLN